MILAVAGMSGLAESQFVGVARRGREFLAGLLDAELGLLPEYKGSLVYWLWHDNFLAAKLLAFSHAEVSRTILASIQREGVLDTDGKTEMFFGEIKGVLPFREYQLKDVRKAGQKVIRTEVATGRELKGWEQYADLLFFAAIAEASGPAAKQHWERAMQMWDGKGFNDVVAQKHKRYATFKLALAFVATHHLSLQSETLSAVGKRLLDLQSDTGGWITDYNSEGKPIGLANVETTSMAVLAVGTLAR